MISNVKVIIDNDEEVCASQFTELNGEYIIHVKTLEPKSQLKARIKELERLANVKNNELYSCLTGSKNLEW